VIFPSLQPEQPSQDASSSTGADEGAAPGAGGLKSRLDSFPKNPNFLAGAGLGKPFPTGKSLSGNGSAPIETVPSTDSPTEPPLVEPLSLQDASFAPEQALQSPEQALSRSGEGFLANSAAVTAQSLQQPSIQAHPTPPVSPGVQGAGPAASSLPLTGAQPLVSAQPGMSTGPHTPGTVSSLSQTGPQHIQPSSQPVVSTAASSIQPAGPVMPNTPVQASPQAAQAPLPSQPMTPVQPASAQVALPVQAGISAAVPGTSQATASILPNGPQTVTPSARQASQASPAADAAPVPKPGNGKAPPKRIGDILIEDGIITPQQLEQALQEGKATNSPLGAVLNRLGYIDEITLGKALAKLHGLQYIDTSQIDIDPEVMKLIPVDFIKRHMVVPYRMDAKYKRLEVIMARPDNLHILDEVTLLTGYRPIPRVSTHKELVALLDKFYRNRASTDDAMARLVEDFSKQGNNYDHGGISSDLEAEMAADDAPVVQLVNSILLEALESGASDIHVEPQKERLLVRFRVDGILREVHSIPKRMAAAFVSRIKVASNMDIAERRRPQDGRMKLKEGSQEVDMRVNTLATQFGEKIVIRLLRANATTGGIEKLGLNSTEVRRIEKMIHAPHGIILVTGPTGSGKTTTLYSCLREINSPERNITTIEDPVEYPLPGINQTQVSHKAGLTFSLCLRAILRQDPDVVMVGEIRDHETLEAAIHASLTGHLVFSTLHTNSSAKTITRLLEMGAPAYMVSTAVIGILAQRLVRRICTHCKVSYTAGEDDRAVLGLTEPVTLFRGEGCEKCNKTGYAGRVGLYEIMTMNREVQELIGNNASTFQIQDAAIRNGMMTLGMDGKRKIFDGMTTVAEVTRVLGLELEEK
jgi:type IV pilus assembly protein PilB